MITSALRQHAQQAGPLTRAGADAKRLGAAAEAHPGKPMDDQYVSMCETGVRTVLEHDFPATIQRQNSSARPRPGQGAVRRQGLDGEPIVWLPAL